MTAERVRAVLAVLTYLGWRYRRMVLVVVTAVIAVAVVVVELFFTDRRGR